MKKWLSLLLVFVLVLSMAGCSSDSSETTPPADAESSSDADSGSDSAEGGQGYVIAFTDAFNGNTFHQAIEQYYTETCEELKAQGIISDYILTAPTTTLQRKCLRSRTSS